MLASQPEELTLKPVWHSNAELRPFVAAEGVTFAYGRHYRVTAIQDLEWVAQEGKITSIIGPSGCGKSTLLRGICGILAPSAGSLRVDLPVRPSVRDLTVTFQTPALLPWLSVQANALLPFELARTRVESEDTDALNHLLATTGLESFRDSFPHQLSGGMAMRAAIVRAFLPRPRLVLMDEPFAALDEVTREKMCGLLEQIWMETRNTVIFVTHNLTEAVLISDRISVFSPRPGRIIEEVDVPLPRPRSLTSIHSEEFQNVILKIRRAIRGGGYNGQ